MSHDVLRGISFIAITGICCVFANLPEGSDLQEKLQLKWRKMASIENDFFLGCVEKWQSILYLAKDIQQVSNMINSSFI